YAQPRTGSVSTGITAIPNVVIKLCGRPLKAVPSNAQLIFLTSRTKAYHARSADAAVTLTGSVHCSLLAFIWIQCQGVNYSRGTFAALSISAHLSRSVHNVNLSSARRRKAIARIATRARWLS